MEKMKKLAVVLAVLVIALGISVASTTSALTSEEIWEIFFPDSEMFGGDAFNETDVPEKQELPKEEQEKNWNVTSEGLSNKPPDYFNVTPRAEWTDKPANWFNETSEGWSDKPSNWFDETPREFYTDKPPGWFDVV